MNYIKLDGVPIRMSWWDEETIRIRKRLRIKNLDTSIEVSQLHEALANYGEIISCKIATDEEHRSLDYGYVQFRRVEDAERAMNELRDAATDGLPAHIEPSNMRRRDKRISTSRVFPTVISARIRYLRKDLERVKKVAQ